MEILAMNSVEGIALRDVIDSMITTFAPFDEAAGEAGDQDVLCLMARLHEARSAAHTIATRAQERTPYKGVRLVKS